MKKNNKQKFLWCFLIIVFFFIIGFFSGNYAPKNFKPENIKYVKIAGRSIRVDLALTNIARERGLSGREKLDDEEGMLFIFDRSDNYRFWMKDMNFPIDIVWLASSSGEDNENIKVIYIKKDVQPESYPKTYGPDISSSNVRYVLEVVSGFSDKNNLKEGDSVEFTY